MSKVDTYNGQKVVELAFDANKTATGYSKYIDVRGYDGVTIVVRQSLNTADGSNYFTPSLVEADATPASTGSYTAVDSTEVQGSLTANTSTGDKAPEHVSYTGNARYLAVKFTETGTADGDFTVYAILTHGHDQPIASDSPTTGTIS